VNHVSGLTEPEIARLRLMLGQSRKQTPGHITTGTLRIELKDDIPVACRPRRLSYSERLHVKKIVQELLADGIISESQSVYASPIVLVKEKTGDLRMYVDFHDINRKAVKDRYPLPHILD
jgi:hypothetical protein